MNNHAYMLLTRERRNEAKRSELPMLSDVRIYPFPSIEATALLLISEVRLLRVDQ